MQTRPLGRTGIDVSEIIFGCGNVGGLLIRADAETMRAAVRRALDLGINWFDTASQYGNGQSEQNLGRLLKEVGGSAHVSTKVRLTPEDLADIPAAIERNTQQCLGRLQRESVDLLQFHNQIAPESGERAIAVDSMLGPGGVADALDAMREKGFTRFIGFTALGETECCRQVIASGRFDTAQVYYNVINPTAAQSYSGITTGQDFAGLIESCRVNGVGIIVIRSLAAGIIATDQRVADPWILTRHTEADEEMRKAGAVFDLLGDSYGTRAQTAMRFALANPDIACIDIGPSEIAHVEEAVQAATMGGLPSEALASLAGLYKTGFAAT
jgi:L-galactose dehydrogenase/L-glyceraldehyde 3-phosphate reductase